VKLITGWCNNICSLTKIQLQTLQCWTTCCKKEKTFQYLAVHPVYQNVNGSNAHFTDICVNSIIPGFTLA